MPVDPTRFSTPNELAERYGVKPSKVIAWIQAGELKAINTATRHGLKPRYKCSPQAIELFEAGRAVVKPPVAVPRRQRRPVAGIIDHFKT